MQWLIDFLLKHRGLERLGHMLQFIAQRAEAAQLAQVASSLTLTSLLSIIPALAVITAAFTAFPLFEPYRETFEKFLFSTLLPEQYSSQIIMYMKEFAQKAAGLTIFGVIGLAVSALLCISNIDSALNRTFEAARQRKLLHRFLMYWALLTLGPLAIGMSLAASSYVTGMTMTGKLSEAASWLFPVTQLLVQGLVIAALYKYVPNCRVRWTDALIGGYVIALIMLIFRWGFGIYVVKGTYGTIYGAFAAIPVFLLWMYIMWMLVLSGAAITATMPMLRARRYQDLNKIGNDFLSAVALLRRLMVARQNQTPKVSNAQLASETGSYPEAVDRILMKLVDRNYVVRLGGTMDAAWALLADPNTETLEGVFEVFAVDMDNSLLKDNSAEYAWLEQGIRAEWLQEPMIKLVQMDKS